MVRGVREHGGDCLQALGIVALLGPLLRLFARDRPQQFRVAVGTGVPQGMEFYHRIVRRVVGQAARLCP